MEEHGGSHGEQGQHKSHPAGLEAHQQQHTKTQLDQDGQRRTGCGQRQPHRADVAHSSGKTGEFGETGRNKQGGQQDTTEQRQGVVANGRG